ncbi:hypothetical protein [Treponema sp. Marseille-Q4523]|uniref:hypothetical protein n=1 Tax=Treponema TaxID=157 RepID=UPI001960E49C|nr:hypothetical protein [Treponema sp. Marseille-Q4523]MBM7024240.1 hypothetical protein [Treponema sp. Marseille-Q4523]
MTVPASAGIQQYTICQGVPTNGDYANKVIAAYFTNKELRDDGADEVKETKPCRRQLAGFFI